MKAILSTILLSAVVLSTQSISAQTGYIYIHTRNLNEESTSSTGFSFNVTGGSTTVPSFSLNDQTALVANVWDIGASHPSNTTSLGGCDLWAVTSSSTSTQSGTIYRRPAGSSTWSATVNPGTEVRLKGTAARHVCGATQRVSSGNLLTYTQQTIMTRTTDNTNTWLDDERVRTGQDCSSCQKIG